MIRRFFIHLALIFIFIGVSWAVLLQHNLVHTATPITPKPSPPRFAIALVPLDSRPPCTDYVRQLAAMAELHLFLCEVGFRQQKSLYMWNSSCCEFEMLLLTKIGKNVKMNEFCLVRNFAQFLQNILKL